MRTKQEIMADAGARFAELNNILASADLPVFPFETAYANFVDVLNFDDAVIDRWFNECMRKTEEMISSIKVGADNREKLYQARQQLNLVQNICEIHTHLVKLMNAAEPTVFTVR